MLSPELIIIVLIIQYIHCYIIFISVQVEKQILRIYYPPQDIIVHEGSSINLMCTFKGPKDTKILWIRKDRSLSPMAKIIGRTEIENSINVVSNYM